MDDGGGVTAALFSAAFDGCCSQTRVDSGGQPTSLIEELLLDRVATIRESAAVILATAGAALRHEIGKFFMVVLNGLKRPVLETKPVYLTVLCHCLDKVPHTC